MNYKERMTKIIMEWEPTGEGKRGKPKERFEKTKKEKATGRENNIKDYEPIYRKLWNQLE